MNMDKDFQMLYKIQQISQLLTLFSSSTSIRPEIKQHLDPKRQEMGALSLKFFTLLSESSNLINDEELEFAEKIKEVLRYGVEQDQQMVGAATERLLTYLREKTALIRINLSERTP